ncbi:MAG: hypothetical protein Q4A00_05750 [Flavobacteriaceae bacterium]|nr:hypothetical protein [Flavobacteriaceae bacterium]
MKITAKTYHHSLYGNKCIVKKWFAPFGFRLFVIGSRLATRQEALRSLNNF